MTTIEMLTVTLPHEMAMLVKEAVESGDYASTSEVVREALHDWKMKRATRPKEMESLRADIDRGLLDLAEGRLHDFDAASIIEPGSKLSTAR